MCPAMHQVNTNGVKVTVPTNDGSGPIVMHQPMHKIAYVVNVGTCTCFIVQRPNKGQFKCHSFETGSTKTVCCLRARACARVCVCVCACICFCVLGAVGVDPDQLTSFLCCWFPGPRTCV